MEYHYKPKEKGAVVYKGFGKIKEHAKVLATQMKTEAKERWESHQKRQGELSAARAEARSVARARAEEIRYAREMAKARAQGEREGSDGGALEKLGKMFADQPQQRTTTKRGVAAPSYDPIFGRGTGLGFGGGDGIGSMHTGRKGKSFDPIFGNGGGFGFGSSARRSRRSRRMRYSDGVFG